MKKPKQNRRTFFKETVATSIGLAATPAFLQGEAKGSSSRYSANANPPEWRNKQSGMAYRMFGNSGMMLSEVVQGTALWKDESFVQAFEVGYERGVNFIDTSPAYTNGQAEKLVGSYLKRSGKRNELFVSNKISFYDEYMVELADGILNGLPGEKQASLKKKAQELIAERGILSPGLHFTYWKGQENKIETTYIRYLVTQEYGSLKKWKPGIKKRMRELVDNSLKTTQTDHFDLLYCPHGVAMPEMLEDEHIREIFDELKTKGTIRFAALSMHNDVDGCLDKAIDLGCYDGAMIAYNIGNHAALDRLIFKAKQRGMGIVAMKVARIISMEETPKWRIEKLNTAVREDISRYAKAYLWALQNPDISCCISDMVTPEMVIENTSVAGLKVDIQQI